LAHRRGGHEEPVPLPLEDYGLLSDTQTAALVGRDGSIDWLCLPRFDSGACFAALLGDPSHGRWLLAPRRGGRATSWRYRDSALVLESTWRTPEGTVTVTDFMPPRTGQPDLVRIVRGVSGRVPMRMELAIRLDYGSTVPWVRRQSGNVCAIAGPDMLMLQAPVDVHGEELTTVGDFEVAEGDELPFVLSWQPSHESPSLPGDPVGALDDTEYWWREWSGRSHYHGRYGDEVRRSLTVLKGLIYSPTGGIVAAPTTSLPEQLGGVRNWDYRYCWVRDATLTLLALLSAGYVTEAREFREWLLRAAAGAPDRMQIMYGPAGEKRLPEYEVGWLPGYEGATPVRIGNAASCQFQLDVYGELCDTLHVARREGLRADASGWDFQRALMDFLEGHWDEPDEGIWEVRGPRRHFTHSKVMAWVAVDRSVRDAERWGLAAPLERWRALRERIHREVLERGWSERRQAFTQAYDHDGLDAAVLMMPLVGFLPPDDPRVGATLQAVQRDLCVDGFVLRYETEEAVDGLPPGEGAFLPCTFWLVDNLALQGQEEQAVALFERLLSLRNDLGLLAEEYDPDHRRMVGNFPQAFSHVGLVNSARNLTEVDRLPARARSHEHARPDHPSRV
jgi:GH15 family glucan-1,4-alpha-glucosidase